MEDENKKIVQDQLAQSVMEKGSVKCPSCKSLIEWEDSEQYNPDGSKDRYFWCSNDECELHRKDVVKVSISKGFLQTFLQNFSKIGQGAIAALFGALSMWGYQYLNPSDGASEELAGQIKELKEEKAATSSQNDNLTKQIADLKLTLDQLKSEETSVPPNPPVPSDNNSNTIDSLQRIIVEKNNEIVKLGNNSGSSQLSPQQMADLGIFYASKKNTKSKEAKKYLFKALDSANSGFTDDEYQSMVSSLIGLRTKLEIEDFEPLLKQIESHMPNNMEDVEKAKVYWYYADAQDDFKEYRKLKLTSLKHYLQGASRYHISQQDVGDGLKLIEMYQLNNIPTENYNSSMAIGTALSSHDKGVIRQFLEYGMKPESKLFE